MIGGVVSFTVSGHAYTATADDYFLPPLLEGDPERPPEGSAVTLYCDPDNPMRFHLCKDRRRRHGVVGFPLRGGRRCNDVDTLYETYQKDYNKQNDAAGRGW